MKTTEKIRIGGHQFAHPGSIVQLHACENYTSIVFKGGKKLMVATTLGTLQERLKPYGFCRPNRGTLVNMNYILKGDIDANGYYLKLKNLMDLDVNRLVVNRIFFVFYYLLILPERSILKKET